MFFSFLFTILLACTSTKEKVYTTASGESVNKAKLLQLVNEIRSKGCKCGDKWYPAVPTLKWNDVLEKVATRHSVDMAKNKSLSHNSSSGAGPGERIRNAGYRWTSYAENIAVGYTDEKTVIIGWLASPGHCSNMMGRSYKEMGIGRSGNYWTQDFGSR